MNYFDSHCHLNSEKMFGDREKYLAHFYEMGGRGLVNVGANDFYNDKGVEISEHLTTNNEQLFCKATVGFHPEAVGSEIIKGNIKDKMNGLKKMIKEHREYIVGVGECGIDLHYPGAIDHLPLQKELFALQCDLTQELKLPLVIHSRDAFDQTLDVLKNYKDLLVYFHCWGYSPEEIRTLDRLNIRKLYIGFCGNVTYKNAEGLRESLKSVPLESLLLETDAPYLTPQAVRGQTNEPAYVKYIYEFVSQYLGIEMGMLCEQVEKNFKRVYNV